MNWNLSTYVIIFNACLSLLGKSGYIRITH